MASNLEEISKRLNKEIGFYPIRTTLVYVPKYSWIDFCLSNKFSVGSSGVFSPKTLTAYVKQGTETEEIDTYHEFYGHGLFFEFHRMGRDIQKLNQRDILANLGDFPETFAIWIEKYLATSTGLINQFNKKYFGKNISEKVKHMEDFFSQWGLFGLFSQLGFPKYYDNNRIKELLVRMYGERTLESSPLIVLGGSKKPNSDIDIFAVSEDIQNTDNHWLDIFAYAPKKFKELVRLFAISLRDPILKGELLFGEKLYQEKLREQWLTQPITREAIDYAITRAKELKIIAETYPPNHKNRRIAQNYAHSYLKSHFELKQGKRPL